MRSTGIFHPGFAKAVGGTIELGMKAEVEITHGKDDGSYDFATGQHTGSTATEVYAGKARVQKVARPTTGEAEYDMYSNQLMRVQIPLGVVLPPEEEWQASLKVTVTACVEDPALVGRMYWVKGFAGSSNAVVRTLHCNSNEKTT